MKGEEARMDAMETRNGKIVDAIVRKERAECPGALALIGIYGSFLTGDVHPLSDLDLLILINDDRGRKLAAAFVEDDAGVGHDLYCTTWDDLREDARYEHPHISKLMDSRVAYCADERYRAELESLRDGVRRILEAPFSEADFERADGELDRARCCFARAVTAETLSEVRRQAGGMLYYAENALALLNKTYFRLGVRRRYGELEAMKRRPADVRGGIDAVVRRGKAKAGDKTMVDALLPAKKRMLEELERSEDVGAVLRAAERGALEGVERTKNMLPRLGRSKGFRENALGWPDPGAVSVSVLLGGLRKGLE